MRAHNAIDFEDMLLRTKEMLEAKPYIQNKIKATFTHVLIDEVCLMLRQSLAYIRPAPAVFSNSIRQGFRLQCPVSHTYYGLQYSRSTRI